MSVAALAVLVAAVQLQVRNAEEPYLLATHGAAYAAHAAGRPVPARRRPALFADPGRQGLHMTAEPAAGTEPLTRRGPRLAQFTVVYGVAEGAAGPVRADRGGLAGPGRRVRPRRLAPSPGAGRPGRASSSSTRTAMTTGTDRGWGR